MSFNFPVGPHLVFETPHTLHMSPFTTTASYMSSSTSSLLSNNEHHSFVNFLHNAADYRDMDLDAEWQAFSHLAPQMPHSTPALAKATKDLISLHPAPRPRPIAPQPSSSVPLSSPRIARISKQSRPTPPPSPPTLSPSSQQHHHQSRLPAQPIPKPTLLSPQQKKANHIQSEQKRRANIRRGYEALCDTVPALREALRAEEQQSGDGRRKRVRVDPTVEGEKVDGRAGPRSESVVLQKTIDHIHGLRDEQSALMARLDHARSFLCPGHPALIPQSPPLWERNWDGGKGLLTDEPDDEES